MTHHRLFIITALTLALAVALGAFGAHALQDHLTERQLHTWETGNEYQFYHGLGALLILVLAQSRSSKYLLLAVRLHLFGILLFSGSLYLLGAQDALGMDLGWLGPLTPIGGVLFIAGWVAAMIGFIQKK